MILIYALIFILSEAIGEGLLKRYSIWNFIFDKWVQWLIAIFLFGMWFIISFNYSYIEVWRLIVGFIFVRFGIFDVAYNLANGQKWNYYGTTKLYDKIMTKLASWGWFMKLICLIVGIVLLIQK